MLLQNLFSCSLILLWSPPFAKVPISQSDCFFCEDAAVHADALSCTFFLALLFLFDLLSHFLNRSSYDNCYV